MHMIVRKTYDQNLYASVLDGEFGRQVWKLGVFRFYLLWNGYYDFCYSYDKDLLNLYFHSLLK